MARAVTMSIFIAFISGYEIFCASFPLIVILLYLSPVERLCSICQCSRVYVSVEQMFRAHVPLLA